MELVFKAGWVDDDLIGGQVAVDFVNTAGGATKARDVERLVDFDCAVRWGCTTGLLSADEGCNLSGQAAADPDRADRALASLRTFREALHACLLAEEVSAAWPMEQQSIVEASIQHALRHSRLSKQDGLFGWQVSFEMCGLDLILDRLSIAAEALLRSDDIARIKNCERCSWLFVDRGRGRPRRWCSMATCGSRAKSARYYSRHRQDSSRPAD